MVLINRNRIIHGLTILYVGLATRLFAGDCTVHFDSIQQRISGFGGSTAWAGGLKNELITELFSPTEGCGLTLVRMRISPNGTTGAGEIDIAKKAQALGASIWAAPWSPPGEWKDNNSVNNGGSLLPSHYQDWADRLVSYVKNLQSQGVDLKWISAQNEPNWTAEYESCRYTPEQLATFIGKYLGPSLERAGLKTGIIAPEVINWGSLKPFGDAILKDPDAVKYCDVIASHSYGDEPTSSRGYPYNLVREKGKELWETEYGFDQFAGDESMTPGIAIAKQMHGQIVNGPVSAYHTWWIIPADGVNGTASNGLVMRGHVIQRGYVMGNYSRFVRPGSYRVSTNDNPSPGIYVTAYRNDSLGQLTIVVINENTSAREQKFILDGISVPVITPWETSDEVKLTARSQINAGSSFSWNLPAKSVVSFVGLYNPGIRLSIETIGKGTVIRKPDRTIFDEGETVTLTAQPQSGYVFSKWSGSGLSGVENPITVKMDEDKVITALFTRGTADGNLVLNGDFSSDAAEWRLNVWEGAASGNVVKGEYRINIESTGTNSHGIQLVQPGIYLEKGKTYEVKFDAFAESDRSLEVNVEMADDPWTSYLPKLKQFDLNSTKKTFSFRFTMEHPDDINGRLVFNVALSNVAVTIDNVSVRVCEATSVCMNNRIIRNSSTNVNYRNSLLRIELRDPSMKESSMKIFDMRGNLVKNITIRTTAGKADVFNCDMSKLPCGFYVVKIGTEKGTFISSKIFLAR
jgi:glucuronoarabinoxylan endo-1,4-beta-xylanase